MKHTRKIPVVAGRPQKLAVVRDIPLQGQLGEVIFPELLLSLYQKRLSGVLRIVNHDEERRITLEEGVPIAIDTNYIVDHALGSILVAQERITAEQLVMAQKEARAGGRRLGEILVESGLMSSYELLETLHYQAQEKLIAAFHRNEGSYRFEAGAHPRREGGQLERGILHILLAGIKNHCTLPVLEDRIYVNRHRVVVKNHLHRTARSGLQLTKKEWSVLDLIDGRRTLGTIMSKSPLNFIRTFQILYIYFLFGIVRFDDGKGLIFQLKEPVMHRAIAEAQHEAERRKTGAGGFRRRGDEESELLHMLHHLGGIGATGVVKVKSDRGVSSITFSRGKPVSITSDQAERFYLGNMLVEKGSITESVRDDAIDRSRKENIPLGRVLIGEGHLGPHDLYEMLVKQAELKLMDLLETTADQDVSFCAEDEDTGGETALDLDLLKVVLASLRVHVDNARIMEEIEPYMKDPVSMSAGVQARIRQNVSTPQDTQIVGAINGRRSIEQIAAYSSQPKENVYGLIYALYRLGMLEFERD